MAQETSGFDPSAYGEGIQSVLTGERMPLGPGAANRALGTRLESLDLKTAMAPHSIRDEGMARACLSGLWLYHNFLDESHEISQDIATPSGNFWHGILHRREPDYPNAKYWFRQVGDHPVYPRLQEEAAAIYAVEQVAKGAFLSTQQEWDPFAFVDLCEAALRGQNEPESLCLQIQQREWELLFDYCYRNAIGKG